MSLYPEHYRKALEIMQSPEFYEQELLLHDFNEPCYRTQKGYTLNGFHWGYPDSLVKQLNGLFEGSYGFDYALVLTDQYKKSNNYQYNKQNSRFSVVKFSVIKESILLSVKQKLVEAEKEEAKYMQKRKKKEEVVVPLTFDKEFVLVTFRDNYADEFDCAGFRIFTKEEWELWKNNLSSGSSCFSFGTNEEIEFSSKKDVLASMKVQDLTTDQAKTLFDLFGRKDRKCSDWNGRDFNLITESTVVEYGMFPYQLGEKDENDEDEED